MKKKEFPLSLVKELRILLTEARKLALENADIVEIEVNEEFLLSLMDKEEVKFFFTIANPSLSTDLRTFFQAAHFPKNETVMEVAKFLNTKEVIIEELIKWLDLIKGYNSIHLSEQDELVHRYEEEFYDEFEMVDEEASSAPFDHHKQLLLYEFLIKLETELIDQGVEQTNPEIIEQTAELRDNIQNLSQTAVAKKFSKILALIKKSGLKLFKEIAAEAKKEIIKAALKGSFHEVTTYIGHHL